MPESSSVTAPLFTILVDGAEIDQNEANRVLQIKVSDFLRLPDVCTVGVGYPAKTEGAPFGDLDNTPFKVGAELEVKMGATDQNTTHTLFKGEIVTLEPSFESGTVAMIIRAYDRSHRMMRSRKLRAFNKQSIGDIVTQLCQDHGFSASVKGSTGPVLDYVIQHNESDWDFMWRLLDRIGFEFVLDDKSATIAKPGDTGDTVELGFPDDIPSFRPRVTAVQQASSVTVHGFDHSAKQKMTGSSASPDQVTRAGIDRDSIEGAFGETTIDIVGQSFRDQSELTAMAQSQLDQLANAYVAAVGETEGNPAIKAGVKLQISGVGRNFSGTYRAARVEHTISSGGAYTTKFFNSLGEHTLVGQSGGSGGGAHIDSLIVGIVTNNNDPEGMGRVKVKLPAVDEQESFWAPVAVPAAGGARGLSMLPVPDEQVIVGFENGDPSYPYVLGSVFNGRDQPGEELAVQDGSFAMKSDHKALFAAKEDITLRSDGGKWIIEIKGGEIKETVNAGQGGQGGYTGQFDGSYNVKANQAVKLESSMQVEISAPQIKISAQGPLQLQGNPVQIDGGSAVTISGGMINLG
jgi:phage protein D/phage baseplate assembly protein gpV